MRRGGPQGGGVQPGGADPDQDRRGRGRHREGTNWLFRIRLRIVRVTDQDPTHFIQAY